MDQGLIFLSHQKGFEGIVATLKPQTLVEPLLGSSA
jgi:hypothetical protein